MTKKSRLQIYLELPVRARLDAASSRLGVSKSKLIEQALEKYFCGQGARRTRFITKANGAELNEET